jgi:hypothetical protein
MNEHKATNARPVPRILAGNHDFTSLYKGFAVICYLFLTVHFACIMVLGLHTASPIHPWIFCYYFGCAMAGYGIQHLTGMIFRIARPKAENNYEDIKRRYKPVQAIPCHIFAVVWFGIANDLGFEILREHAVIFSHNSIYPLIFAIGGFVLMEYGAYLWFFPYNVLVSMRSIAIVGVMMLIQTVVLVYVRGGFGLGFYNLSLVVTEFFAILIYMVLLNQCFLTRQYDNRVSYVNDAAKLYSAGVVAGAASLIVLMAQVVRVILIVLLKILEQILGRMFIEGETGTTPYSPGFGYGFMQQLFDGEDASSNGLIAMLLLGLLFVTLFIIIVSPGIRERLLLLWEQLLADLAEFFKLKKKYRPAVHVEERFVDTVENLTRRTGKRDGLPSLAAFERQLSRIVEPEEKYAYAYSVYAKYMELSHGRVLVSDTPRERSEKVRFDERYPDAGQYAEVFEEVRYANEKMIQPEITECLQVLNMYLQNVLK